MKVDNEGQSTVEFLLTFGFVFGFLVTFIKLASSYAEGYLVHYATFMSARTFLVADANTIDNKNTSYQTAISKAEEVFKSYRLENYISGKKPEITFKSPSGIGDPRESLFVGAYTDFEASFVFPFSRSSKKQELRSEALLGKEPVRAECLGQICNVFSAMGVDCGDFNTTSFDNGC